MAIGVGVQLDATNRMQQNKSLVSKRTSFKDISETYTKKNVYENLDQKEIQYSEEQIAKAKRKAIKIVSEANKAQLLNMGVSFIISILITAALIVIFY